MSERDEPAIENLDVSLTQAPLLFFIPFSLAIIFMIATFALGTFFHTWKTVAVPAVLWPIAAVWTRRDRNAINVFLAKLSLIKLWLTAHRYGGYSVSPPPPQPMKMGDDHAVR